MGTIGLKFPRMIFVGADQTNPSRWGSIYGDITDQTDLINYITSNISTLEWGNINGNINDQLDLMQKINDINTRIDDINIEWGNIGGDITDQIDLMDELDDINNRIDDINIEWGNITGDITDQLDLMNELDDLNTRIDNINNGLSNLGNQVIKDITIDNTNTNTVSLIKKLINPQSGIETDINIDLQLQSATNGGIMPSAAFNQIATNTSDIGLLQQIGVRYATHQALPETLSQNDVLTIFQTDTGKATPNDGDTLVSFHSSTMLYAWIYFSSSNTWIFKGITAVMPATNTTLGIVQGSTNIGDVSVNLDSTLTANGLSNAITDIGNLDNRLTTVESDVSTINSDITNINSNISDINTDISVIQNDIIDIDVAMMGMQSDISNKVDKIQGMGLSTNDFTNAEKTKLGGIEQGAQVNVPQIQSDWNQTNNIALDYIQNKPLIPDISSIINDINDLNVRLTNAENDITEIYKLIGDDVNPNENYLILSCVNNSGSSVQINTTQFLNNIQTSNITELKLDFGNEASVDLLLMLPSNTYDIYPGVQFKLIMKWIDEIPVFSGNISTINTMIYNANIQLQQPINGVIGDNFMSQFLSNSKIQSIDIDLSNITATTIGNNFMSNAFSSCHQLKTANIKFPKGVQSIGTYFMMNTFNNLNPGGNCTINIEGGEDWNVTQIPNFFMMNTFSGGIASIELFDTSNWYITRVGNSFLSSTFSTHTLKNIELFDTTNWSFATVSMIGTTFISNTFTSSNMMENITLKGGLWINSLRAFTTNSMGLNDNYIQNIKVDPSLIATYQSSASWTNITPTKFISY